MSRVVGIDMFATKFEYYWLSKHPYVLLNALTHKNFVTFCTNHENTFINILGEFFEYKEFCKETKVRRKIRYSIQYGIFVTRDLVGPPTICYYYKRVVPDKSTKMFVTLSKRDIFEEERTLCKSKKVIIEVDDETDDEDVETLKLVEPTPLLYGLDMSININANFARRIFFTANVPRDRVLQLSANPANYRNAYYRFMHMVLESFGIYNTMTQCDSVDLSDYSREMKIVATACLNVWVDLMGKQDHSVQFTADSPEFVKYVSYKTKNVVKFMRVKLNDIWRLLLVPANLHTTI